MTINLCDTGCGNVALVGTNQCLQHVDPAARVPVPPLLPLHEVDGLLERMGAELDAQDFTAAHDSVRPDDVRPEIAEAIQAAAMPGGIITIDRELSADELAELKRRFEEACTDTRLRVIEPPCIECGTTDPCGLHCLDRPAVEPRRSIVGRIWRRLRRWTR